MSSKRTGAEAVATKGWIAAHQWLLARRLCQLVLLALFLLGPASSFICGALLYVDGGFDAMSRPDAI